MEACDHPPNILRNCAARSILRQRISNYQLFDLKKGSHKIKAQKWLLSVFSYKCRMSDTGPLTYVFLNQHIHVLVERHHFFQRNIKVYQARYSLLWMAPFSSLYSFSLSFSPTNFSDTGSYSEYCINVLDEQAGFWFLNFVKFERKIITRGPSGPGPIIWVLFKASCLGIY